MPELETVEKQKTAGFVSHRPNKNEERIRKDEEELEALEKAARGETGEEEEETKATGVDEGNETKGETEEKELKGEERTYKKRYGDLRRHQQKVEKELKERIDELQAQLSAKKDGIVLPKSDEDIEAWMKKYPDVAGIVTALVAKESDKRWNTAKSDLEEIRKGQTEGKLEKARREIIKAHEDFEQIEQDDAFHDWVDEQPAWIANALYENSDEPKAVIRVLDLYKADTSGLTPKQKKEREAASNVSVRSKNNPDPAKEKGKIYESDVKKMSSAEYEKREEEILEAIAKGNFVYDISAGAR